MWFCCWRSDVCCVSVLRLLKEGADPNTLIPSGGSLLHLVRHKLITELTVKLFWIQSWPDCYITTSIIRLVINYSNYHFKKGHTLFSMALLIKLIIRKHWWLIIPANKYKNHTKIMVLISSNCYNLLCALTVCMISQRKCKCYFNAKCGDFSPCGCILKSFFSIYYSHRANSWG